MAQPKGTAKPADIGPIVCVIAGMAAGAPAARAVAARWFPPQGPGLDTVQLIASAVGGALGAVLCIAAWSLVARLFAGLRRG